MAENWGCGRYGILAQNKYFDPRELASIYLGPLMSLVDRNSLIAIAAKYSHIRIYEVAIGMSGMFLFNEIHT